TRIGCAWITLDAGGRESLERGKDITLFGDRRTETDESQSGTESLCEAAIDCHCGGGVCPRIHGTGPGGDPLGRAPWDPVSFRYAVDVRHVGIAALQPLGRQQVLRPRPGRVFRA